MQKIWLTIFYIIYWNSEEIFNKLFSNGKKYKNQIFEEKIQLIKKRENKRIWLIVFPTSYGKPTS